MLVSCRSSQCSQDLAVLPHAGHAASLECVALFVALPRGMLTYADAMLTYADAC
jgi:hypothetical protein